MQISILLFVCLFGLVVSRCPHIEYNEIRAADYLKIVNSMLTARTNFDTEAEWAYASDITDEHEQKKNEASADTAKLIKEISKELKKYCWQNFKDPDLRRQFKHLSKEGYAALTETDYKELLDVLSSMQSNYAKVKVCSYEDRTKCNLTLEPEIDEIFTSSRNPEELKFYWTEWYGKAGTAVKDKFLKYLELNKKAALLNNYTSGAEVWLAEYEDPTFERQLENIFEELRPLYEQIHGYVRWRLRKVYGNSIVSEKGPIPMHLLGNMWGQQWSGIAKLVSPFPNKPLIDVTQEMLRQGYTPLKMFEMGDQFFKSLNMTKLPNTFWEKSILEKPKDGRELVCHASAWDFYKQDDVRIKQCTRVNQEQLFVVHHELGHIQYFLQYQHLPFSYRTGANPGFHEAVGDVLSLSVSTPKHLQVIGLLKNYKPDYEARINQLFLTALDKIVFLPFAFTMDKYRWSLFRGQVDPNRMNCAFWKLREQYSGIEPPVRRTEDDFDAPAKYHISADVEYLRYLVSFIVQFQFYKSACQIAGQYDPSNPKLPLDNCDFYGNVDAGNAFKQMLSMGASKPWPDAMEVFTGDRTMSGKAIAEYFEPLRDWLSVENKKHNVHIGWENSLNIC